MQAPKAHKPCSVTVKMSPHFAALGFGLEVQGRRLASGDSFVIPAGGVTLVELDLMMCDPVAREQQDQKVTFCYQGDCKLTATMVAIATYSPLPENHPFWCTDIALR